MKRLIFAVLVLAFVAAPIPAHAFGFQVITMGGPGPASTSAPGIVEYATDTETKALTATDKAVTPSNLGALNATTSQEGILETATDTETKALTATDKAVTPGNLGALNATTAQEGIAEFATDAEVQTGTATDKMLSPGNIQSLTSTTARDGIVELATPAEVVTGTATTLAVTPEGGTGAYLDEKNDLSDLADLATAWINIGAAVNIVGGSIVLTAASATMGLSRSEDGAIYITVQNLNAGVNAAAGFSVTSDGVAGSIAATSAAYNVAGLYSHLASRIGFGNTFGSEGDGIGITSFGTSSNLEIYVGQYCLSTDLRVTIDTGGIIVGNATTGGTITLYDVTSAPTPAAASAELWYTSTTGPMVTFKDFEGNTQTEPIVTSRAQLEIDAYSVQSATGDLQGIFAVPAELDGWVLSSAEATVYTKGATGTLDITLERRRVTTKVDMLSTAITVGDEYFAADGVINTSNDDVAQGDTIIVNIDAVHTTPNYGLWVTLIFRP